MEEAGAKSNWQRYLYGVERGHRDYTDSARLLEGMYLGGGYDRNGCLRSGGQWTEDDLAILSEQGRPAYEWNEIKPAVDAALGYQIANRMDIAFRPRSGDASKELADVRSKIAMQIADNNRLHWSETDVFGDGFIQQRGYFECRMDFDDNILGELRVKVLDPLDVIPDPDAKSYDPADWADVIITRWMTLDEIEGLYGLDIRKKTEEESTTGTANNQDFGADGETAERGAFGTLRHMSQYTQDEITRYRVIDRQHWIRELQRVAIHPSGDIRPLSDDTTPEAIADMQSRGIQITKRRVKRVRWTVSTMDTILHDDWSPYDRFTIVPFFPYFRRGKTRGGVDNAVGPQIALNKAASQAIHIINTTANSGWQLEEGQLANMSTEQLMDNGAKTGLILERKAGTVPLQKIQPNTMPHGIDSIIERADKVLKDVTIPDAMRGVTEAGESGIAIQSRQHASQQILSVPLDNLARTRNMLASWINYAIAKYYDSERVFRITSTDPLGREQQEAITINQLDPKTGMYLNDMTAGEYEVVVTEQPMQITFENSQFTQIMEMRNAGVRIPDPFVVRYSNLTDKHEIQQALDSNQAPIDPTLEAKARLINAQADTEIARKVETMVKAQFAAMQAGGVVATNGHIAPVADAVMQNAGYQDPTPGGDDPNIPQAGIDAVTKMPAVHENTSPAMPPVPASALAGIETTQNEGAM